MADEPPANAVNAQRLRVARLNIVRFRPPAFLVYPRNLWTKNQPQMPHPQKT
jgi:hypothetical protein